MKTMVAVPCMDQVPARFAHSLAALQRVGDTSVAFQIGSLIYTSRNELARRAVEDEADYVFWLDSDMVFEPDALQKLMKHIEAGKDMVTGLYFRRVPPFSPVLFRHLDINEERAIWSEFETIPDELFKVEGCGFGCVLMRTEIFMDVASRFGDMFGPLNGVGEDLSFCWRAKQCGFEIWCDPSVEMGHVGYTMINRSFFNNFRKAQDLREARV